MLKTFMFTILVVGVCVTLTAQTTTNVEQAVRYRVTQNTSPLNANSSAITSTSQENANYQVLENRSSAQLDELGSRYGFVRSNSQLDELGSRYGFVRSNSQLDELGSRYGFVRSNSQLDELGSRYGFVRSNSQLDELGSRYGFVR